ncbi:type IX secretion system membrane protein PorP/SprF [bacterium]|nr:type IX secretion system membrane protein PorP/SprF [bacterium]
MKRLTIILFMIIAGAQISSAQQMPLYSQYMYNRFLINPSAAGSEGYTSFNVTAREQWVGYAGSPRTYSLSYQARFTKKKYALTKNVFGNTRYKAKTEGRAGMGLSVFSDQNGLVQRTGFQAAYSYHIWVQDYTQLSFGIAATGYHYIIKADEESFRDPSEPWLADNLRQGIFVPDINFGLYLLNERYTLGFSAESLLGAAARIGDGSVDTLKAYDRFRMSRHYYAFGSYSFLTAMDLEIEPSVLLKMSEQLLPQADFGLTFIYDQTVWLGAGYRTGGFYGTSSQGALIGTVRVRCGNMYLGYSYDYTLSEIESVTSGSHELVLALKLQSNSKKYRWLDRY